MKTFPNMVSNEVWSKKFTIQVVAPNYFIEPLKEALLVANQQKYKNELQFVFCENVEQQATLQNILKIAPDFISIVLDPTIKTCCEITEDNIGKIDSDYKNEGKICLVNGSCNVKTSDLGVGLGKINLLSKKWNCILINGNVLIPDKCICLALRITELATSVCGYFTGIPVVVNTPGYDEVFN